MSSSPLPNHDRRRMPRPTGFAAAVVHRARRLGSFEEAGTALALAALVAVIGALHPDFLGGSTIDATLRQAAFVALVAYGMVFLLAMGEIDLSVGGIYAVSITLAAKWMADGTFSPWVACGAAIAVATAMGAFNGVLAALFRIPVLIVTLGTYSVFRGLVTVISGGQATVGIPLESNLFSALGGDFIGLPVSVWITIVMGVILTAVLRKTRLGAMVRAIGSNRAAAAFAGIPSNRIRIYALMLTGALAGLAGVLSLVFFEGSDPSVGLGFELQVIAAAIIGGTSISGGRGTILGAFLGALIISVVNSGLVFFSISSDWQDVVTGVVILIAIGADALIRRRREARAVASI